MESGLEGTETRNYSNGPRHGDGTLYRSTIPAARTRPTRI